MTTQVHLIRHGETEWNSEGRIQGQSESELNEQGRAQARELGNKLRHAHFDAFYCSSSRRARETMSILHDAMGATIDCNGNGIRYMEDLREIYLGPWEGMLKQRIIMDYPQEYENFWKQPHNFRLDGAETIYDLQNRGLAAIRRITEECTDQTVMVVSHGALVKTILSSLEGRPLSQLWDPPRMDNCAHSIVEFDQDQTARILKFAGHEAW